ncbi:unnamed protein product, partial [Effrenium voratum]
MPRRFTSDGALRPLRDTLQLWLEEGRCAQHIEWDENQKCYTLAEPLKSYVAWNDPSNLGAMPNDALFDTCGNQAEYNIKDAEVNNLVMELRAYGLDRPVAYRVELARSFGYEWPFMSDNGKANEMTNSQMEEFRSSLRVTHQQAERIKHQLQKLQGLVSANHFQLRKVVAHWMPLFKQSAIKTRLFAFLQGELGFLLPRPKEPKEPREPREPREQKEKQAFETLTTLPSKLPTSISQHFEMVEDAL